MRTEHSCDFGEGSGLLARMELTNCQTVQLGNKSSNYDLGLSSSSSEGTPISLSFSHKLTVTCPQF